MNPAAVITGIKGSTGEQDANASETDPYGPLMGLLAEPKEGRVLSGASVS